jgi:MFS transporter, AAHS family, benzoate transport protein
VTPTSRREVAVVAETSSSTRVRWLTWSAFVLAGYDLVVLSVVIPELIGYPPSTVSLFRTVVTLGLLGTAAGALVIGPVADLLGRRRSLIGCVVAFSVLGAACALARDHDALGLLRFAVGVPLGGALPVSVALVAEHAPPRRGAGATLFLLTGGPVGALLASAVGPLLVPVPGWWFLFVLGALPALVLVPIMVRRLPAETVPAGRDAAVPRARVVGDRLREAGGPGAVAFAAASFLAVLTVYGLTTWLPRVMRTSGYEQVSTSSVVLALEVGAVIGLLVAGWVADRVGPRRAALTALSVAAVVLALLAIRPPGPALYTALALAAAAVFAAPALVWAWIGRTRPARSRGTAVGLAIGLGLLGAVGGPTVTGPLSPGDVRYPWSFPLFAVVAALAAASLLGAPRTAPVEDAEPEPAAS